MKRDELFFNCQSSKLPTTLLPSGKTRVPGPRRYPFSNWPTNLAPPDKDKVPCPCGLPFLCWPSYLKPSGAVRIGSLLDGENMEIRKRPEPTSFVAIVLAAADEAGPMSVVGLLKTMGSYPTSTVPALGKHLTTKTT
jgi:hypothetical protein